MTFDQFIAAQSRTYRRARALQAHLNRRAAEVQSEGFAPEANTLILVGERVWACADAYVSAMFRTVP